MSFLSKIYARHQNLTPIVAEYKIDIKDFKMLPKLVNSPSYVKDYFLTGGCWGMALAIHALLKKNGYSPKIKMLWGHAYVEVGTTGIDATGIFNTASEKYEEADTYSVREFREAARTYGPPHGADTRTANEILEKLISQCTRKKSK